MNTKEMLYNNLEELKKDAKRVLSCIAEAEQRLNNLNEKDDKAVAEFEEFLDESFYRGYMHIEIF